MTKGRVLLRDTSPPTPFSLSVPLSVWPGTELSQVQRDPKGIPPRVLMQWLQCHKVPMHTYQQRDLSLPRVRVHTTQLLTAASNPWKESYRTCLAEVNPASCPAPHCTPPCILSRARWLSSPRDATIDLLSSLSYWQTGVFPSLPLRHSVCHNIALRWCQCCQMTQRPLPQSWAWKDRK